MESQKLIHSKKVRIRHSIQSYLMEIFPGLLRQGWIDLHEAIRYIFMYSAL